MRNSLSLLIVGEANVMIYDEIEERNNFTVNHRLLIIFYIFIYLFLYIYLFISIYLFIYLFIRLYYTCVIYKMIEKKLAGQLNNIFIFRP